MSAFDTSSLSEEEFLHRQLCPDGSCIGLLDAQGVCKECGMVGGVSTRDPRLRGFKKEDVPTPAPSEVDPEEAMAAEAAGDDLPEEFEDRRLCPDGSCIGVVGTTGVCGECGTVA
tara:strand:- start:25461 stop:25805 length:345 start_codon:yes stop_codon:yes gene_type:complete